MQLKIERIDDKQVVDKLQIASDKKIIPCKVPTYLLIWLDCIQNGKKNSCTYFAQQIRKRRKREYWMNFETKAEDFPVVSFVSPFSRLTTFFIGSLEESTQHKFCQLHSFPLRLPIQLPIWKNVFLWVFCHDKILFSDEYTTFLKVLKGLESSLESYFLICPLK